MIQKSLSHIFALFAFYLRFSFFVSVFGFLSIGLHTDLKITNQYFRKENKDAENIQLSVVFIIYQYEFLAVTTLHFKIGTLEFHSI